MDGSQGIAWTADENGVRTYFGPRWTGERQIDWSQVRRGPVNLRDYAPSWEDQKRMMRQNDAREWTPNGMRPR